MRAFWAIKPLRLLIVQVLLVDIGQVAVEVAAREPVSHGEVLVQVVAALLRSGTGDIALKASNKLKQLADERQNLLARQLAKDNQIKARAAAHGAKVDNAARPLGMIAEERRAQVLDGVALGRVHDRLLVGRGQAQVKRCDGGTGRRIAVDAAHIHAGLKQQMINRKAGDALHGKSSR